MATKADWQAAKAAVVEIEKEREALLATTKDRYDAACDHLELIEEACPERVGRCEGCAEPIWQGDRYAYDSTNAVWLCEPCAPEWGEMLENPDHFVGHDGEYLTAEQAKAMVDAHLAAGGKLTDKMVSE